METTHTRFISTLYKRHVIVTLQTCTCIHVYVCTLFRISKFGQVPYSRSFIVFKAYTMVHTYCTPQKFTTSGCTVHVTLYDGALVMHFIDWPFCRVPNLTINLKLTLGISFPPSIMHAHVCIHVLNNVPIVLLLGVTSCTPLHYRSH